MSIFISQCLQELAWASYALLCNTNTCSVLALVGEQAVLARGAVAAPANQADAGKASLEKLYSVSRADVSCHAMVTHAMLYVRLVTWRQARAGATKIDLLSAVVHTAHHHSSSNTGVQS